MENVLGQLVAGHLHRMLFRLLRHDVEPMTSAPVNLMSLGQLYGTDEQCREVLTRLRWPNGVRCLRCGHDKVTPVKARKVFDCNSCHYQFSVIVGTMFADSHLPLTTWFMVTYLLTESKKGMSAHQIYRMLGKRSYKTAWYLCHRIRAAMVEGGAPSWLVLSKWTKPTLVARSWLRARMEGRAAPQRSRSWHSPAQRRPEVLPRRRCQEWHSGEVYSGEHQQRR